MMITVTIAERLYEAKDILNQMLYANSYDADFPTADDLKELERAEYLLHGANVLLNSGNENSGKKEATNSGKPM